MVASAVNDHIMAPRAFRNLSGQKEALKGIPGRREVFRGRQPVRASPRLPAPALIWMSAFNEAAKDCTMANPKSRSPRGFDRGSFDKIWVKTLVVFGVWNAGAIVFDVDHWHAPGHRRV